ncbi:MAG: hypothetical protein ACLPX7_02670 [Xanthobacteraceae bacterium]
MARSIYTVLLVGTVFFLCISANASAQGRRYSLSPVAPFPCDAVSVDGNSITFRQTMVFVCNGKEQLEMPAGSIMGINAVCSGTTLILHHDFGQRNSLFDILHRRCGRSRARG